MIAADPSSLHLLISRPSPLSFCLFTEAGMGNISLSSLFSQETLTAGLFFFLTLGSCAFLKKKKKKTTASITQNEVPHNPGQPKGVFNNYLLYVFGKSETSVVNLTETAPKQF